MYYARRGLALRESWDYISTITDGMQLNRCLFLLWYGHRKPPPVHIKQHLQGVLMQVAGKLKPLFELIPLPPVGMT